MKEMDRQQAAALGNEIRDKQKKYVLQSWNAQRNLNPIPIQYCDNIYLYDYEGNRYADMSSMHVNVNVGYGNKEINQAIIDKLQRYAFISEAYADKDRADLAEMIIGLMPDNMGKVFFTNAGADANENAIKIARMYTGRHKIFSRYRSYHGSSFGAGNLSGEPRRFALEPGAPGFIKFRDPYRYRDNLPFDEEEYTAYCLRMLEEQIHGGETVFDIGCGSGILGIAAAKLGAGKVYCTDLDAKAVKVAGENTAENGVDSQVSVYQGDLLQIPELAGVHPQVVVSNIIADVIIGFCPDVYQVLAGDGVFIASGIIRERAQDVTDALTKAGFEVIRVDRKGSWCAVLSRKAE